jgi:hypothetical protein
MKANRRVADRPIKRSSARAVAPSSTMQLRVARLCLDCEDLHVEDRCPVCGSDQYAFLSSWLPSEERRRWRRPAKAGAADRPLSQRLLRRIARWLGFEIEDAPRAGDPPRTRASDRVPDFSFDESSSPTAAPASRRKPARPLPQSHDH